ncbi:peptide ABC transporter [candidate division KSB3 bacterium]|uniref:Peptide ABC transporter n=1 Tax=candidate division KSB3 bacterium TaxID=2044937 RepID=A0A2G6K7J2_9BACT|nr:MAG: peptide ABC transporter [candidate division KSB3 bacterium]
MKRYILKRLILIIFTLFGLLTITFAISRVAPGDPARLAAGPDATEEMVEVLRKEFGLDQPLLVQYGRYLEGLLAGDLGRSLRTRHPVLDDLFTFFPATLELTLVSIGFAIILGIPLGVLSAVYKDRWIDHFTRFFSVSGVALPMFWLGLMLQLVFSLKYDLLPIGGRIAMMVEPPKAITHLFLVDSLITGNFKAFGSAFVHILLPAFVLSFPALASIIRLNRADMLEILHKDFILSERAHGISNVLIIGKYALKNALIPTVTMIGLRYGWMLGGTLLVETVFDWPGIGLYAVQSAIFSDFQSLMGVTVLIGVNFMLANLIVDLLYGVLDPRVRYT